MTTGVVTSAAVGERVPQRYRREIALHLFKNLEPQPDRVVPLLLGVHGPSGEGKTFQCTRVLTDLGCSIGFVSGGELESPDAGEPARLLRSRYLDCALRRGSGGSGLVVLFINDVDVAIGDWGGNVQYTANRQSVFGELMHLADYPTIVENRRVPRVPIILTGNDFTKMHGPAVRPGRMRAFAWIPTVEEKAEMLTGIFPELAAAECLTLAGRFPGQSMAFFSQVRNQLTDEVLWSYLESSGIRESFKRIAAGQKLTVPGLVTVDAVSAAAEAAIEAGRLVNHL